MKAPNIALTHIVIVEEVSGAPENEKFFLYDGENVHNFFSFQEAAKWCESKGYTYNLSKFEP